MTFQQPSCSFPPLDDTYRVACALDKENSLQLHLTLSMNNTVEHNGRANYNDPKTNYNNNGHSFGLELSTTVVILLTVK